MYIARDIFSLRFGMFREASQIVMSGFSSGLFGTSKMRILTDFTGESYRLIIENSFNSLSEYEQTITEAMKKPEWKEWYNKFKPYVEKSYREILREIS